VSPHDLNHAVMLALSPQARWDVMAKWHARAALTPTEARFARAARRVDRQRMARAVAEPVMRKARRPPRWVLVGFIG
jgi:hypothetical protein